MCRDGGQMLRRQTFEGWDTNGNAALQWYAATERQGEFIPVSYFRLL